MSNTNVISYAVFAILLVFIVIFIRRRRKKRRGGSSTTTSSKKEKFDIKEEFKKLETEQTRLLGKPGK